MMMKRILKTSSDEFKNENVRIDYIKDSEFAFSKIKEIQPDLIILDLLMPKVDGITLSHKLKLTEKPDTFRLLSAPRMLSVKKTKNH